MKALIVYGLRHGEWIDVLDGVNAWVDIRTATTHRIRKITWQVTNVVTGEVTEAYTLMVAVHPDLVGPNEPGVAGELLRLLAMNEFVREHGEAQEIPKEPAGSSLIVPGGTHE
jgi:hypothetical protein